MQPSGGSSSLGIDLPLALVGIAQFLVWKRDDVFEEVQMIRLLGLCLVLQRDRGSVCLRHGVMYDAQYDLQC